MRVIRVWLVRCWKGMGDFTVRFGEVRDNEEVIFLRVEGIIGVVWVYVILFTVFGGVEWRVFFFRGVGRGVGLLLRCVCCFFWWECF